MKHRALLSVFNKEGILELSAFLAEAGWEIISTGGTAKHLKENNIPVRDVSSVTGFPECLDGRVKTLHPAIHAGILACRENALHMETLEKLNLTAIDLVCVNLYPFIEKETIEFIDIGGPAMLRSAAKNFKDVIVLTDTADYGEVITAIKADSVSLELRKHLAAKVFALTSSYDAAIARYMGTGTEFPLHWPFSLKKAQVLRYGENSHQSAALYFHADSPGALAGMEKLHGKELGYNNIRDMDLAWKAASAFGLPGNSAPFGEDDLQRLGLKVIDNQTRRFSVCCSAVKHNTPCGIALGETPIEAFEKTLACDPVSIYGGIVAFTAPVSAAAAEKLAELFLEIVVAPGFEKEALEILMKKKNLRIMKAALPPKDTKEYAAVDGGLLVQDTDKKLLEKWEVVTQAAPNAEDIQDMIFGMRAVSFVKSNAIVVVKDLAASGIGCGQVNRIWAAKQALERSAAAIKTAAQTGKSPWADGKPAQVLASDAFFPFADVVEAAAAGGIKAIIQPGGSINDKLSIEACNDLGLSMVFTGIRHFRH